MSRLSGINRTQWAIALGGLLVVLIAVIAVTSGVGHADPADDGVAKIDFDYGDSANEVVSSDGEISKEAFDKAVEQAAKRQGLPEVPAEDDPQFEALRDQALNDVLDTAWILGEAKDRGVEVTEREVTEEFEQTKSENFKTEEEYQKFLEQSGFSQEDVDLRVKLQLLSTQIQDQITEEAGKVPEDEAKQFYEDNADQFEQPGSRDIRFILTPDQGDADKAADELKEDNSPERWDELAKKFSTDEATKDAGGVRQGVTEGSFDPALDSQIFDAPEGEVVGPVETPQGFYVFQVDSVTEAGTIPFDDARAQIEEQLTGQRQQEVFSAFLSDYRDRWVERTICADDFAMERCDNFDVETEPCPDPTLPPEQQQQQLEQVGCPPPVISASPVAPGAFDPFVPAQAAPQRPHPPGEDVAPPGGGQALPGGVPGGAGQVVPGG